METEYYTPGVYNPPTNAHYTEIPFKSNTDIHKIIGRNGKHFKTITKMANVQYIWFNHDKKNIEIWGQEKRLPDAIKLLNIWINQWN